MNCKNCGKTVFVKETCSCGETAPDKNGGGVIVNNVICIIFLVAAVLALIISVSLRYIVNNDLLTDTVKGAELAMITVKDDDSGETLNLDEWLYNKYIDDERITVKNVDNVLNNSFIKDFLIEKIHGIQDFLMDEGDAVTVTSDDIITLIDKNSDLLYNEAGLNFLEPDKDELRKSLSGLDDFAEFTEEHMSGWFASSLVQTPFSLAYVIFLTVLLGIILAQWLLVYRFNGRRMLRALRGYSIAFTVPAAFVFLISFIWFILNWKAQGGAAVQLGRLIAPFLVSSGILLAVGVILLVVSVIAVRLLSETKTAPESADNVLTDSETPAENDVSTEQSVPANEEFAPKSGFAEPVTEAPKPVPEQEPAPDNSVWSVREQPSVWAKPAEEKRPESKPAAAEKPKKEFVFCTKCGNKNRAGSAFCSKCGNKLRN